MMGVVGRIARVLGPKGLMPNPKTGTVTMDVAKAIENYEALMNAVLKAKPAAAKGQYIKNVTVATSMGPGIKLNARS